MFLENGSLKNKIIKEGFFLLLLLFASVLFFHKNLDFSKMPQMGDYNLWVYEAKAADMKEGIETTWINKYFSGNRPAPNLTNPKRFLLPLFGGVNYAQVSLILYIFLSGYFMFLFLRYLKIGKFAALFGAFAYMFTNPNLTLIFAGHMGKFETMAFFPGVLLFLTIAVREAKLLAFAMAGFLLGASFLGIQVDVAAYFAIWTGFYFLYLILSDKGEGQKILEYYKSNFGRLIKNIGGYILLIVITVLMALPVIVFFTGLQQNYDSSISAEETKSDKEKWDFATQWSFPPEEVIDFFVPGVFGYKTGDQAYPYIGRMAQGEQYPAYSAPPRNFKLNGENMGLAVILFTILALMLAKRREKWFLAGSALVFLLLSFGRYFSPPYSLLMKFPLMDSFRNPNKLIHLFVIPITMLSAFGMDYFVSFLMMKEDDMFFKKVSDDEVKKINIFNYITYAAAIGGFVAVLIAFVAQGSIEGAVSEWSKVVENGPAIISSNVVKFLFRFLLMAITLTGLISFSLTMKSKVSTAEKVVPFISFLVLCIYLTAGNVGFVGGDAFFFAILATTALLAGAVFLILSKDNSKLYKLYVPAAIIFILVFDLWQTGQFYLKYEDPERYYSRNAIVSTIDKLKPADDISNTPTRINTVALTGRLYRHMQNLEYFNVQMIQQAGQSRPREDMKRLFNAMNAGKNVDGKPDFFRYLPQLYSLANIEYLITDYPIHWDTQQLKASRFTNSIDGLFMYPPEAKQPSIFFYKIKDSGGRAFAADNLIKTDGLNSAINLLKSGIDLNSVAVIHQEEDKKLIEGKELKGSPENEAEVHRYSSHEIRVKVNMKEPGLVVLKEPYHPDWEARVGRESVPLLKANGVLFAAVVEKTGEFEIIFRYKEDERIGLLNNVMWILFLLMIIATSAEYFINKNKKNGEA